MVVRFTRCDRRRLKEVLQGGATDRAESELAGHLEECEHCRRDLEMMAGGPEVWGDVRSFLSSVDIPPGPPGPVHSETTTTRDSLTSSEQAAPGAVWRRQLGFLTPSEVPDSLGRLGAYEITDVIGRGGMGIVLKAFDPALNRHVAIKVLAAEWAHNATARRRFAREAKAAAAVVHDHVVPIHYVDAAGEVPYLVMACISGHSLQERLDQSGPLELKEILRIGMQAAAGLAAAHAQGLVHRDIKPANILLENSVERVRITDFGLARAVDDVSQTQSGVLAGTPQYMSPEQAAGYAVDHRTDLFSLGSVLYAMCTGRSPFRAETAVAVLRRICDGRPHPIRDINPEIPDWLAEIIGKLHEKNPADRFQTASEVADLLEQHLAHLQQPQSVPRPGKLRGRSFLRSLTRSRKWIGVGAAALVIAVIVFSAVINDRKPAKENQERQADDGQASNSVNEPPVPDSGSRSQTPDTTRAATSRSEVDRDLLDSQLQELRRDVLQMELPRRRRESPVSATPAAVLEMDRQLRSLESELKSTAR